MMQIAQSLVDDERRTSGTARYDSSAELDWSNLTVPIRNNLVSDLLDSYERCFDSRHPRELLLLAGPPGVGKTTLAFTLKDQVVKDRGCMIRGKFDPLEANCHATPTRTYAALTEAFTEYIEYVVQAGDMKLMLLQQALQANMDQAELQVLRELIPDLACVLGDSEPKADRSLILKGADAENRFIHVFTHFVRTICSQEHRIILLLDDLQWANPGVLNLAKSLLVSKDDNSCSNLMLMGTFRSNEISADHLISSMLREVQDQGVVVTEIIVPNMTEKEVNDFISIVVQNSSGESKVLADALFAQTQGNLLFVIQLLKSFREEGILVLEEGSWKWEMNKVLVAAKVGSLNALVKAKVERLTESAQETLRIASCLGSTFPVTALSFACEIEGDEFESIMQLLETRDLVYVDRKMGSCRFVHDKVQQAVYELTPECVIDQLHLNIGRRLRKSLPKELLADLVLLVARQISLGVHLIDDPIEQHEVAELFFAAGQEAALSSSFVTAAAYLKLGISLLGRRRWKDQYTLSLRMYNLAAELEYYNGNLQRVDELVDSILLQARSFDDTLLARFTRIYSLGSRGSMQRGLSESMDFLHILGEKFPRKPGVIQILLSLIQCKRHLHRKTDDDILNLPSMTDKRKQAVMRLLIFFSYFAFYLSGEHLLMIAFRLVEYTLRYGMSEMACVGFALYGAVAALQGNIDEAYRFSKLALMLFGKYESIEWHARIGVLVYGIVYPLKHSFRYTLESLHAAHLSSLVLGDVNYSMLCFSLYNGMKLFAGFPLSIVVNDLRDSCTLCSKYGQHNVLSTEELTLQFALNLMGQSSDPLFLTGEIVNEDVIMQVAKETNPVNYLYMFFLKLELAVYMNDSSAARTVLVPLKKLDHRKTLPHIAAVLLFFEGIASAMSPSKRDRQYARKALAKLKVFAKHSPSNFLNKLYLIEAELASQAGNYNAATTNFILSIQHAGQNGLIQDQALAHERAAYSLVGFGRLGEARENLTRARLLYKEWGADGKVAQLDTNNLLLATEGNAAINGE